MRTATQAEEAVSRPISQETLERLDERLEYLKSVISDENLDLQGSKTADMSRQDPWVAQFDGAYALSELYWSYRKMADIAKNRRDTLEEVMKGLAEYCPERLTVGKTTVWMKFGDTLLRIVQVAGQVKYDMEMLFRENPAAKRRAKKYQKQGKSHAQNKFELDFRG